MFDTEYTRKNRQEGIKYLKEIRGLLLEAKDLIYKTHHLAPPSQTTDAIGGYSAATSLKLTPIMDPIDKEIKNINSVIGAFTE